MAEIKLSDNCKSFWEADKPKVCGLPPVRIVLGRKGDNVSFLEASQDHERGTRWMHHSVCYHLNHAEILRLYKACEDYLVKSGTKIL